MPVWPWQEIQSVYAPPTGCVIIVGLAERFIPPNVTAGVVEVAGAEVVVVVVAVLVVVVEATGVDEVGLADVVVEVVATAEFVVTAGVADVVTGGALVVVGGTVDVVALVPPQADTSRTSVKAVTANTENDLCFIELSPLFYSDS